MTAQPQENRYEVMMWVREWDRRTEEWSSQLVSQGVFASLEEAQNVAQREHDYKKALRQPNGRGRP